MSLRKKVEHFAEQTSMHGLKRVILTKKPEKRVAWVIVFVTAWALFAFQLTKVLTKYFEYSKKTTTEFLSGGAPFPAITLCNMQSIDFYVMHKYLKTLEELESSKRGNKTFAEFVGRNSSYLYYIALIADLGAKYENQNTLNNYEKEELLEIFSRTTIAANLPEDVLSEIAIKQEEFIVKCRYGNSICNFTEVSHPYFLKCFTFEPPNIANKSFEKFQSLSEGIENGFSVTVFTGTKLIDSQFSKVPLPGVFEKNSPLSGSSGVRVVIHPPGTEPFPLTEGYDVPPGYQASIGIIPSRRQRLGRPYGYCAKRNRYKNNYLKAAFGDQSEESEPYRKVSCERMCMQQHVIKECKCIDETLPKMGDAICANSFCMLIGKNNTEGSELSMEFVQTCRGIILLEVCALDDSCDAIMVADTLRNIRCADTVINRLMTDLESLSTCNCFSPCEEYRYDISYSLAKWPSSGYEGGAVFSDIFDTENFTNRFTEDKREVYVEYIGRVNTQCLKDFAKINVYVTDSNVLQTIEEAAITMTQLISDIGGQLGIWIGVSVITISEVLETVLTIVSTVLRRMCCKFQRKKTGSVDDHSTESGNGENKSHPGTNYV